MANIVTVVVGSKAYSMTRKMANTVIDMAKQKYKKENVNAIVAVERDGLIALQKDVHTDDTMVDAMAGWMAGGYKVYYVKRGEK